MAGYLYQGKMFGSETSRRCRELRDEGVLKSDPSGKFEIFYLSKEERKEDMTDINGLKKWKEMGAKLGSKRYQNPNHNSSLDELVVRKTLAEKWLKENESHPKYAEALSRYEKICDEISLLKGVWIEK